MNVVLAVNRYQGAGARCVPSCYVFIYPERFRTVIVTNSLSESARRGATDNLRQWKLADSFQNLH